MTKCETSCEYKLASLINLPKLDVQIWFWCANFNNSYTMRYQRKRWYYTWFGGLGLSNKVTWAITLGTQMQKPHATLVGWNLLVEQFLLIEWNAFANEFLLVIICFLEDTISINFLNIVKETMFIKCWYDYGIVNYGTLNIDRS